MYMMCLLQNNESLSSLQRWIWIFIGTVYLVVTVGPAVIINSTKHVLSCLHVHLNQFPTPNLKEVQHPSVPRGLAVFPIVV